MAVTRRDLIVTLAVSALASLPAASNRSVLFARAQTPAPTEDKLQKAYAEVRDNGLRLRQIAVPIELEPAFVFEP